MDLLGNMSDVRPLLPPLLLQSPLSLSSSSYLSHIPHEGKLVCINEALQLHPDGPCSRHPPSSGGCEHREPYMYMYMYGTRY